MEHPIQSGNKTRVNARRGYTLIELIIVMAIVSILMAIAVPQYQKSLRRTKETLLHSHLQTLRTVIDEFTFDKKKAPQTLQDLVAEGYLRAVPIDPITGNDEWRTVQDARLWALERLRAIMPEGHEPVIHLSLTDDHPYAQAFVIIEAVPA